MINYGKQGKTGVYGIYVNNKLFYVGKTTNFKSKCLKTTALIEEGASGIYKYLNTCKKNNAIITYRMVKECSIEDLWIEHYNMWLRHKPKLNKPMEGLGKDKNVYKRISTK